jgi:hypothetical protein
MWPLQKMHALLETLNGIDKVVKQSQFIEG